MRNAVHDARHIHFTVAVLLRSQLWATQTVHDRIYAFVEACSYMLSP